MKFAIAILILLAGNAHAAGCISFNGEKSAISYAGQKKAERKVQFVAERNAKGDKYLFGFPQISSIDEAHKDKLTLKYTVHLMEVYGPNDKEFAGSRDVVIVLDRATCAVTGGPVDLGAN